jgi:multidrug resistance protein, MATE family
LNFQNLRALYRLFIPVLLFLLGMSITAYIERIFLAQYSENALAGSLNGFFLARIFQFACLTVIIGGQTFIGLFHGSNQPRQIGPCVWQLVWFSIASVVVVPPIGFLLEHFLYSNTALAQTEGGYFSLLCWFNFLVPLGGAFSAFYLGRGKTLLVSLLTLGSCALNIGLDYVLIFGNSFIPAMGTMGASLGKVISQGAICAALGYLFLSSRNHATYATRDWSFQPLLFYHYVKPGLFRALGAVFCYADWSFVTRTMSLLSETHVLVYSIGATIFYFFTFASDALFQAMVTMSATFIGKKQNKEIWSTVYNGFFIIGVYSLLLCIPFYIFPEILIFCFKATSFEQEMLTVMHSFLPSLWLALIGYGVCGIPLALIVASRDTVFLFWYYAFSWLIGSVPTYLAMVVFKMNPDKFWLIVVLTSTITALVYFKRVAKQRWLREDWRPADPKLAPTAETAN